MGNGWHEWPLMIFTVLGQCVVGGLLVVALVLLSGRLDGPQTRRLQRAMFFLWLLMGLGFIASVMHLGSPLRAINALNRLGDSALSNEIAAGSLFFMLGGLYWLLAVLNRLPAAPGKVLLIATMLTGMLFIYTMCRVYAINTVPTWDNGYTAWHFVLTLLAGGPVLGTLLLRIAGVEIDRDLRGLALVSVLALLISMVVSLMQASGLAAIAGPLQPASALVPYYGGWQAARLLLLALGLGCWICPLLLRKTPAVGALALATSLVLGGELIGRALFYGLHMTVGMAIAG
ncbi:dimethylsulfoxide reductase [Affinibrenneria salicis]|uniref:Dimethylsulfoxide reductase n=1 Tax=Affinibrenneria salicis TaxID=2590031 RepID=A0A5J5G306_9GAMM|nr:DmsC/YnfH family molybdoenzyme membrane anchor subunit [Affinibrenneria salicis]KAA9001091.1 dimethylsulfoxide reductase [Affinibrenneria salicis]